MKNSPLSKIPVLRALSRYYRELAGPAPLAEFNDYNDYWLRREEGNTRPPVMHRYRVIASRIPDGATVLDIGCGDGAFLKYLKSVKPNCKLMGADLSEAGIRYLQEAGIEGHVIRPGTSLPQQISRTFDYVVMMEVIEHVHDAEGFVRDALGFSPTRVFITIPNVGFLLHRLRLALFGRFPVTTIVCHMKEHIRFWTVKDFVQWAGLLGLRVIRYDGQLTRPDIWVRWMVLLMPALFAAQMIYELEPVDGQTSDGSSAE